MPMYNKKSAFLKGDRRNPCTYRVGRFEGDKYISYENYGFVQERNTKMGLYCILPGTGDDEVWYPIDEVTLVKGHWTNKKRKTNEENEQTN